MVTGGIPGPPVTLSFAAARQMMLMGCFLLRADRTVRRGGGRRPGLISRHRLKFCPDGSLRAMPYAKLFGEDRMGGAVVDRGICPMKNEIIFLVEDSAEGGYAARALAHSIFTFADTLDELRVMVKDAVNVHFDEGERPSIIRLHFVREKVLAA